MSEIDGDGLLKPINLLEIETQWGYKTFELYHSDITRLDFKVDVLAISAFFGNYVPLPHTVIGALSNNCSIDVKALSQHCEFNLRDIFNCWVARPPDNTRFERLLCVEFMSGSVEIEAVIQNLFVMLSILEMKGIKVQTLALPVLGAGEQKLAASTIIKALLDGSQDYMRRSPNFQKVIFVEFNERRAHELDRAMNDALGRVKVVLPRGKRVEGLREEILKTIERAFIVAGPKGHDLFGDLRRFVSSDQSRSFELGIISRRLVEFIVDDLSPRSTKFELWKKIDALSEHHIADWIRSYMHVLRVLGNESAHEKDREKRVPKNINEADMELCLFCLQRLVDFWLSVKATSSAAKP